MAWATWGKKINSSPVPAVLIGSKWKHIAHSKLIALLPASSDNVCHLKKKAKQSLSQEFNNHNCNHALIGAHWWWHTTRLAGELLSVWAFNGQKSQMTGCDDNNVGGTLKPHAIANAHRVMETPQCLTDYLKPTHYASITSSKRKSQESQVAWQRNF